MLCFWLMSFPPDIPRSSVVFNHLSGARKIGGRGSPGVRTFPARFSVVSPPNSVPVRTFLGQFWPPPAKFAPANLWRYFPGSSLIVLTGEGSSPLVYFVVKCSRFADRGTLCSRLVFPPTNDGAGVCHCDSLTPIVRSGQPPNPSRIFPCSDPQPRSFRCSHFAVGALSSRRPQHH